MRTVAATTTNAEGETVYNMSRAQTLAMLTCRTGHREGKAIVAQRRCDLVALKNESPIGVAYDVDFEDAVIRGNGSDEVYYIPKDLAALLQRHVPDPDRATKIADPDDSDWYWCLCEKQWWESYNDIDGLEEKYPNDRTYTGLCKSKKAVAFQRQARKELRKRSISQK